MRESKNRFYWWSIIGPVVSAGIALCLICISMQIWRMDLSVPMEFSGDSCLGAGLAKSIVERGIKGIYFSYRLGAPGFSSLIDTPFIDFPYGVLLYIISRFVSNPNCILYIAYIITFPLSALTMNILLSKLNVHHPLINVFFSVAFAITPYHFLRGINHLTLSTYYIIPIAIYIAVILYEEDFKGIIPSRYYSAKWKAILLYFGCLFLGISNIYYAFFGLMSIIVAYVAKLIKHKNIKFVIISFIREAFIIYSVFLGVILGLLPKIIYTLINGKNAVAAVRAPLETELYCLKIVQLILPASYNRISILAKITNLYSTHSININENSCATLGLLGTIGFVFACGWIIKKMTRSDDSDNTLTRNRITLFSFIILCMLLYATMGGFGTIVSFAVTAELRGVNRCSIYIACLSLALLSMVTSKLQDKILMSKHNFAFVISLLLTGVFVLYTELPVYAVDVVSGNVQQDQELKAFFSEVENKMPENAMIYELPFMEFPESASIEKMGEYEPMLGYIYTNTLQWSYGGIKGRNNDAQNLYVDNGMSISFVNNIIKAGFKGVYIDTSGYSDGGNAIISFYSDKLNLTPIVSEDKKLYFYDISSMNNVN